MQPVGCDGSATGDTIEDIDDIGVADRADRTRAPTVNKREPPTSLDYGSIANDGQRRTLLRLDRPFGVNHQPEQSSRPLPGPAVPELVVGDVAPDHRLETVVNLLRSTPCRDLVAVRIGPALDIGAQLGRCRTCVLEREHGIAADRVLDRLAVALATVAQRP